MFSVGRLRSDGPYAAYAATFPYGRLPRRTAEKARRGPYFADPTSSAAGDPLEGPRGEGSCSSAGLFLERIRIVGSQQWVLVGRVPFEQ